MHNKEKIARYQKLIEETPVKIQATNHWLTNLVCEISVAFFNKPFRHRASYNNRLKTTGGRYRLDNHHLEFNWLVLERLSATIFVQVILHELCHYHLHLMGKGYRHRDQDFKRLLKQTGGLRYVPNLRLDEEYPYLYQCLACEQKIHRFKKIDTKKYRCRCHGQLSLIDNRLK